MGRVSYPLLRMLRVHCGQLFYNVSDPEMDEMTILNFRHLLERHGLGKVLFDTIKEHLAEEGLLLNATVIKTRLDKEAATIPPLAAAIGMGVTGRKLSGPSSREGRALRLDTSSLVGCRERPQERSLSRQYADRRSEPDLTASSGTTKSLANSHSLVGIRDSAELLFPG